MSDYYAEAVGWCLLILLRLLGNRAGFARGTRRLGLCRGGRRRGRSFYILYSGGVTTSLLGIVFRGRAARLVCGALRFLMGVSTATCKSICYRVVNGLLHLARDCALAATAAVLRPCLFMLLILVTAKWDSLLLTPRLPREAEAAALVVPSATGQANARRLPHHHPIPLHLARVKEVAPRALLARVYKRAAPLNHLTSLGVFPFVVTATPVRTRLGGIQLRGIKLFLLVPTERRHSYMCYNIISMQK
jgi:hypothetical protein